MAHHWRTIDLDALAQTPLPALEAGVAHLWRIRLDASTRRAARVEHVLDEHETSRADRYIKPAHGANFRIAHGALRLILGGYAGEDPSAIEFSRGERDKPALTHHAELEFNLSHSGDWALIGLMIGAQLGVDTEHARAARATPALAAYAFSPLEAKRLEDVERADRAAAFYRIWTRKEAFIKAIGLGLHFDLEAFDVEHEPTTTPKLLGLRAPALEPMARWRFFSGMIEEHYPFAICSNAPIDGVETFELTIGE